MIYLSEDLNLAILCSGPLLIWEFLSIFCCNLLPIEVSTKVRSGPSTVEFNLCTL
jgi:hypothetical protein